MFSRAQRTVRAVKAGVFGPAGSGKTWSALALATGLAQGGAGKVALVDSEGGRAAVLADEFRFDMQTLTPPYCPTVFASALREAAERGYDAVVLDGLSQAWTGVGGVLEQVDAAKAAGSRTAWLGPAQAHEELLQAVMQAPCHVLATMRARPLWEVVEHKGENGATLRRKIQTGLRPEQRSDIEYLFDVFWQLGRKEQLAVALKDSTGLFTGSQIRLGAEIGRQLLLWSKGARPHLSGLERALHAIRACSSVAELAALWGDWPEDWKGRPWQEVCSKAVAQRLRELQAA